MSEARTTFLVQENRFLRTWVRELIQERDSLRQELIDARDQLMFPVKPSSRCVSIPYEVEDLPF